MRRGRCAGCRRARGLHRSQLPDGHWALAYGADADWVLGADDVLRVVS